MRKSLIFDMSQFIFRYWEKKDIDCIIVDPSQIVIWIVSLELVMNFWKNTEFFSRCYVLVEWRIQDDFWGVRVDKTTVLTLYNRKDSPEQTVST